MYHLQVIFPLLYLVKHMYVQKMYHGEKILQLLQVVR